MARPIFRKLLGTGIAFCIAAGLGGLIWLHFAQRRTLPFALTGEPVLGRRVYAFGGSDTPPPVGGPLLHEWPVIGDPVVVAPEVAAELREILSSPSTYTFADGTCFEPGMAVSFGSGTDRVDAVICLLCNRAVFYSGDYQVGHCISEEGNKRLSSIYRRIFRRPLPTL